MAATFSLEVEGWDRDRLQKSTVEREWWVSAYHNHDPFGRLDTVTSGGTVMGRYVDNEFDRIIEQRAGTRAAVKTTRSTFDAWDRVATKTDAGGKTTAMSYLGLSSHLLAELDIGAGKQKTAYTFDADGQRLTQTSEKADGTSEDAWYGYGPRGDVEALTTAAGETKSTYGYTAYGKDRAGAMTGADKPGVSTEPYNLYRFGAKRWDPASGDYDMGFRTYNPGLNRFTSRDMYNGALADLNLGTDPWNTNRYTFAGGNPITRTELDGHCNMAEEGGGCDRQESTGSRAMASRASTERTRQADPPIIEQRGHRQVTAKNLGSWTRAYNVAKSERVGQRGGQSSETSVWCGHVGQPRVGGGTCGHSDVIAADLFAGVMCRQPGISCTQHPIKVAGEGLYELPGGMRIGGGPESGALLKARAQRQTTQNGQCSFTGETRVLMVDGTTKPISKIKIGDKVLATDPTTGKRDPARSPACGSIRTRW